jgi:hypothetical protein
MVDDGRKQQLPEYLRFINDRSYHLRLRFNPG